MSNIIVDTIKQVARLAPPKTVRLSMPDTDHVDAVLWITYDTMTEMRREHAGVAETGYSRPADTYHVIAEHHTMQEWHDLMSEAGWTLGADYMWRWYHSPRGMDHLFGLTRYHLGDGDVSATGDAEDVLAEVAKQFGAWEWEINSMYGRKGQHNKAWFDLDERLDDTGCRAGHWAGWSSEHPILRSDHMDYESHYYYRRPKIKYNRHTDILAR